MKLRFFASSRLYIKTKAYRQDIKARSLAERARSPLTAFDAFQRPPRCLANQRIRVRRKLAAQSRQLRNAFIADLVEGAGLQPDIRLLEYHPQSVLSLSCLDAKEARRPIDKPFRRRFLQKRKNNRFQILVQHVVQEFNRCDPALGASSLERVIRGIHIFLRILQAQQPEYDLEILVQSLFQCAPQQS